MIRGIISLIEYDYVYESSCGARFQNETAVEQQATAYYYFEMRSEYLKIIFFIIVLNEIQTVDEVQTKPMSPVAGQSGFDGIIYGF